MSATPSAAPAPPPPQADPSDPPVPSRRAKLKASRARARATTRAAKEEAQAPAAAAAARSKLERAAKSRASAQVRRQARQATKNWDAAAAAAELKALTAARELARLDAATLRALGNRPLARYLVPPRRGDALAAQLYRTIADHPPPLCAEGAMFATKIADANAAAGRGEGSSLCRNMFCLKPLAPSAALVRRCHENGWPLPLRC